MKVFRAALRWWEGLADVLHRSDACYAAGELAGVAAPGFYFFLTVPACPAFDDPYRRVPISRGVEMNLDGVWIVDGTRPPA